MIAARFWRLTTFEVYAKGVPLGLTEVELYDVGGRVDSSATVSSSHTPSSGLLSALGDASLGAAVTFSAADVAQSTFAIVWDFGAGVTKDIITVNIGSAANINSSVYTCRIEYSSDGSSYTEWPYRLSYQYVTASTIMPMQAYDVLMAPQSLTNASNLGVTVLLHLDGVNGQTNLVESSLSNVRPMVSGSLSLSTAQKKFGTSSARCTGGFIRASGLSLPSHPNPFQVGNPFGTIEFWFNADDLSVIRALMGSRYAGSGTEGPYLDLTTGGLVRYADESGNSGAIHLTGNTAVTAGTWNHVALIKNSTGLVTLFVNGVKQTATYQSGTGNNSSWYVSDLNFGAKYSTGAGVAFLGYIDEIRVTSGTVRYTANFTPESSPFPGNIPFQRPPSAMRYVRIVSPTPTGTADLELSEIALYEGASRVDGGASITASVAPVSGTLSSLNNGNTSSVVKWSYADLITGKLSILIDLGDWFNVSSIKFGAGASAASFPSTCGIETSSDGVNFVNGFYANSLIYPGANTLGGVFHFGFPVSAATDPYEANVALRVRFDGRTLVDTSPSPKALSLTGGSWDITTPKHGDASFNVTAEAATFSPTGFDLTGDFTIEFWMKTSSATSIYPVGVVRNSGISAGWYVLVNSPYFGISSYTPSLVVQTLTYPTPTNTWAHYAVCRSGTAVKLFVNGTQVGSGTMSGTLSTTNVINGSIGGAAELGSGAAQIDDLRITFAARYTANFVPPDMSFLPPLGITASPVLSGAKDITAPAYVNKQTLPAYSSIVRAWNGRVRDMEDGGSYRVAGTVKEKASPSNLPLSRRVRLHNQTNGRLIREAWSDPVTGAYSFDYIRGDQQYYVVSFDHTGAYRGVIADYQIPTLITA